MTPLTITTLQVDYSTNTVNGQAPPARGFKFMEINGRLSHESSHLHRRIPKTSAARSPAIRYLDLRQVQLLSGSPGCGHSPQRIQIRGRRFRAIQIPCRDAATSKTVWRNVAVSIDIRPWTCRVTRRPVHQTGRRNSEYRGRGGPGTYPAGLGGNSNNARPASRNWFED